MATEEEVTQMKHMLRCIYNQLDSLSALAAGEEGDDWENTAIEIFDFLNSTKTEKGFIWET